MFPFLKALFFAISFGGLRREITIRISPFEWRFNRHTYTGSFEFPRHVLNVGPLMFLVRVFSLLLIMASTAAAQQPYWRGTPPKAVYRQPIQVPIYQPGVRIYYHSQHVPLPGFGTVITNQYRYGKTKSSTSKSPRPTTRQGQRISPQPHR